MTVTSFDTNNLNAIRADFKNAVAELEAKYGIKMQMGRISYSATSFSAKIDVTINNAEETGVEVLNVKWKRDFERNAFAFGLKATDYGREVTIGREKFKLVGATPRSHKLIVQGKDTKCYSYPASMVTF